MKIYFRRNLRGFFNDKGWKLLISVVLITLLICSVTGEEMFRDYDQTRSGAFALVCACIWIGIFNSIRVICREREILKREHRTGLHMSSYVAARWLFEACLCAVEAVPVTVIVRIVNNGHFIRQGIILPPTLELFVSFFLITFSADALALVISAVVKDENTAFAYSKEMEATVGNLLHQWGILLLFAVVYAILTIIALEFVDSY